MKVEGFGVWGLEFGFGLGFRAVPHGGGSKPKPAEIIICLIKRFVQGKHRACTPTGFWYVSQNPQPVYCIRVNPKPKPQILTPKPSPPLKRCMSHGSPYRARLVPYCRRTRPLVVALPSNSEMSPVLPPHTSAGLPNVRGTFSEGGLAGLLKAIRDLHFGERGHRDVTCLTLSLSLSECPLARTRGSSFSTAIEQP